MRNSQMLAGAAAIVVLVAASPVAAQEPDPTGMWEGRWVSEARHHVEGPATPRQLRHKGRLEARFDLCVGRDGSIAGSGTARVKINGSRTIIRVFENGTATYKETFEPDQAEVPVKLAGERRGESLVLRLETGTVDWRATGTGTLSNGHQLTYTNSFSTPAIGLLVIASSGRNPLATGIAIAAQNGAEQEVSSSDVYDDSDAPTRGVAEYRTRVQIRRPKKDAADELPILLGEVFEEDTAGISPEGEKKLESVLPRLKCQPQGSSITVVTTGEDDLFLEALSRARLTHLQNWFREHGVDTASIEPRWRGGPEDDVQVSFGQ